MLQKGIITELSSDGSRAVVKPVNIGAVTPWISVSGTVRTALSVGTEVLFVLFPDATGIVIARMDGEEAAQ